MGRKRKLDRRRKKFLSLAKEGRAFCKKHQELLGESTIIRERCYDGNHGKGYCPYFADREVLSQEKTDHVLLTDISDVLYTP